MFEKVDEKKRKLDQKRPLPKQTLHSIREHLLLYWTYNSNAIEGNTLTLSETKVVLEGITIGGKTIREHLEAINHKDAILYVEEIIANKEPFSEWQIKNIHRLILKGIDDLNAGTYRKENVLISGAKHIPPGAFQVPTEMNQFVEMVEGKWQSLHPVERAARVHIEFVKIHPFIDGNGRTARLLLNLELMKAGYPPIVIDQGKRAQYYSALDNAHTTGDFIDFIMLVEEALNETFELYFKVLA